MEQFRSARKADAKDGYDDCYLLFFLLRTHRKYPCAPRNATENSLRAVASRANAGKVIKLLQGPAGES